jgi:hypothetical protein
MSKPPTSQTFACPKCGKRFSWKEEFSGRNFACTCGQIFKAILGLEEFGKKRDLYEMEKEESSTLRPEPVKRNITAVYPRRKSAISQADKADLDPEAAHPIKHTYFPWIILLAGIAVRVVQILYLTQTSMRGAILLVVIDVHLNAAIMLVGAYSSASFLGVDFGSFSRTSVKLAGIAIFTDALGSWAIILGHRSMPALVLGIHLELLLYFVLFYAMFELDLQESLVTVVIVWVLQGIAQVALYSLLR